MNGMSSRPATVITGVTGCIGSLVAQKLLADSNAHLLLPIRPHHRPESVIARLARDLPSAQIAARVTFIPLPPAVAVAGLAAKLRQWQVDEFIHCAGCVDYFHRENLAKGNPELTGAFVELARMLSVRRFVFISTAFSSGYRDGLVLETLHDDTKDDPTEYTRSKREAEAIVAGSGLPYLIIRPS